jgi:hypothetical protein
MVSSLLPLPNSRQMRWLVAAGVSLRGSVPVIACSLDLQPIVFRELHEGSPFEALEIGDFADVAETFVTWRHVVEALNASVLSS